MSDVYDHNQVEKLACFLSVKQSTIAQLKREYGGDPVLLGMKILGAWHQNLVCDDVEEARRELAGALKKVGMGKKAKEVWSEIGKEKACIYIVRKFACTGLQVLNPPSQVHERFTWTMS